MAITQAQVLEQLKRIKGPDLEGNIVDLGLVSEILVRDDKVYFSITVTPDRAAALEPLRQAAEKVVKDIPGVQGVTAVLTAEAARGGANGGAAPRAESPRVQQARAQQSAPREAPARPPQAAPGGRPSAGVPGIRHMIAVASGKGGVGKSSTPCSFLNSPARYSTMRMSKSSPPRKVSPLVDFTSKRPSSISRIEMSKVPPPRS
jgi:ATP-binding protein involved in chromosome partitioning